MIPCYVSGKGMHATQTTWDFKVRVIATLESTGLGYDTRYRYYQKQFPELEPDALARKVCDPIEDYDKDWPAYRDVHPNIDEDHLIARFMFERDEQFRAEAHAAIYCLDEAGFGSGVNVMRFIRDGKPILGFYDPVMKDRKRNVHNVFQLQLASPELVTLMPYSDIEQIPPCVVNWLNKLSA